MRLSPVFEFHVRNKKGRAGKKNSGPQGQGLVYMKTLKDLVRQENIVV